MSNLYIKSSHSLDTLNSNENSLEIKGLLPLETAGFISVLEDALDQTIMLGNVAEQSDLESISLNIDNMKNRCALYAKNDPIYKCLNGELFTRTLSKLKFLKLFLDRAFLENFLRITREELFETDSFHHMTKYINDYIKSKADEQALLFDHSYNKECNAFMKTALKNKIEESQKEAEKLNKQISKCQDDLESFLFDDSLKMSLGKIHQTAHALKYDFSSYIENWEKARLEQNYMITELNESELINEINKYKTEIAKEYRIHVELVAYINENQKEMEEAIETWMKRYDIELEEKAIQLTMTKHNRAQQKEKYEKMLIDYEVHAQEIEEWLVYKEKKRIREEIEKQRNDAATKIQAWWKGMMFRHKLGPWNPDPQPIKKKKKKEKKKKGKKGKKKETMILYFPYSYTPMFIFSTLFLCFIFIF